jgi:hypothetical protein
MGKDFQKNCTTDLILKRLDEHILNFQDTLDYKLIFAKLDLNRHLLRESLQECDSKLAIDVDDTIVEIIHVLEAYFYIKGFRDGNKLKVIFKRFLSWIIGILIKVIDCT